MLHMDHVARVGAAQQGRPYLHAHTPAGHCQSKVCHRDRQPGDQGKPTKPPTLSSCYILVALSRVPFISIAIVGQAGK